MRRLWRTGQSAPSYRTTGPLRDTLLICLADGIVAAAFGATAVAGGLPWWVPVIMSIIVFAGGSQIAATSVAIAGGGPIAAVAAGALLNTRLVPYGFAVAGITRGRWWTRLLGAHLTTDESVAFALREPDPKRAARAFWTCGGILFAAWNASVALGVLAGTTIRDTGAFGLDATFPAVMLALALPALTQPRARASAATGAVVAVALTPVLPAGLPVLASLAGLTLLSRAATPLRGPALAALSLRRAFGRGLFPRSAQSIGRGASPARPLTGRARKEDH